MNATSNNPSQDQVRKFVDENFLETNELLNATLTDWVPEPSLLGRIRDPSYREWAADLNEIWKGLARRMTTDVRDNPKRHSLIYVNNTFIIPGGRFKGMQARVASDFILRERIDFDDRFFNLIGGEKIWQVRDE